METLRITISIGIITLLSACSEKVDEETLETIETRLSAIESIDARITSKSTEKDLIEIELREIQEVIERYEAKLLEALSQAREELELTRDYPAGNIDGFINELDDFKNQFRKLEEENANLKDQIELLKSNLKD